jgi:cytochrome c-type biogenesis protein CcmH/NrfG
MNVERRRFGLVLAGATLFSWIRSGLVAGQVGAGEQMPSEHPKEQPPANQAQELAHARLQENEKRIKKDAEKLLQLAQELKTQVDNTDSASVLSVPIVRQAEEIEKLARSIKQRARGQ